MDSRRELGRRSLVLKDQPSNRVEGGIEIGHRRSGLVMDERQQVATDEQFGRRLPWSRCDRFAVHIDEVEPVRGRKADDQRRVAHRSAKDAGEPAAVLVQGHQMLQRPPSSPHRPQADRPPGGDVHAAPDQRGLPSRISRERDQKDTHADDRAATTHQLPGDRGQREGDSCTECPPGQVGAGPYRHAAVVAALARRIEKGVVEQHPDRSGDETAGDDPNDRPLSPHHRCASEHHDHRGSGNGEAGCPRHLGAVVPRCHDQQRRTQRQWDRSSRRRRRTEPDGGAGHAEHRHRDDRDDGTRVVSLQRSGQERRDDGDGPDPSEYSRTSHPIFVIP